MSGRRLRAVPAVACLLAVAGCGPAPRPTALAPPFGASTGGTVYNHRIVHHGTHHGTHHRTTTHSSRTTHAHGTHTAHPAAGPALDFTARTRARCDSGDANACRMLNAMEP